ncbi:hypothetical protein ATJ88_3135 [Isoptericola jiangsuensis]|uniref:Ig-like domain-containing protein n=1 Tax=Isoptericola jiangsuensis TaxID=548579 RepID=A0A2A9F0W5_9MICO|nr:hypothetical protein [Isoptericola jiangsuensis]PFG44411.1 hypothetical protein ATJ88_3135 [Isoptericola jiangsuensis]
MPRRTRRTTTVVAAWLVAVLVATGLVPAAASEPASAVTLTVADRWWAGQAVTMEIEAVHDGLPAPRVFLTVDGTARTVVPLVDGRATFELSDRHTTVGEHRLDVWQGPSADPASAWSTASADVQVVAPTRPVVRDARVYGDPAVVGIDLTGTDLPLAGEIELASTGGTVLGTAPLVGGVAELPVTGTERVSRYRVTQRDTATGTVLSTWVLDARVAPRPVAVTVEHPRTWRHGSPVEVTVRVTSDLGPDVPVAGEVVLSRWASAATTVEASLRDGKATFRVDPEHFGLGTAVPFFVWYDGTAWFADSPRVRRDVTVKPPLTTRTDLDHDGPWTYGTAERVTLKVTAEDGARVDGRAVLSLDGRTVRSVTVVDGRAHVWFGATAVEPGTRRFEVRFTPSSSRYDTGGGTLRTTVERARPKVRLTMPTTTYRVGADLGRAEPGLVRVRTAGLPERGKLVLQTRDPSARNDGWRTRSGVTWRLTASDRGDQKVRIPAKLLRRADGGRGSVYLRVRYVPADTQHVSTVVSPPLRIRRT